MRSENHTVRTTGHTAPVDDTKGKSNTQLLKEIDKLIDQGDDMDCEKLERYLSALQQRTPVMTDYDPHQAWEQLQAGHPLLFEEEQSASDTQTATATTAPRRFRGHKLLRTLEIAALLSLVLVVSANAMGFHPVQAILEWFDEVVQVYSDPSGLMELPEDDPSEFHTLEATLEADGLGSSGLPTWVPKDYSLRLLDTKSTFDSTKYSAIYQSNRGELLIRVIAYHDSLWTSGEERELGGKTYIHNNIEFYLVSNYDQCKAGWQLGRCSYIIRGQISEDELKKIIDSIE